MNEVELSLVPVEARPYQGRTAGIVTRLVANTIDALLVGAALIGTYLGVVAFRFVVAPRDFTWQEPSLFWFVLGFFGITVVYLTAAWWISGRTIGDHVMGIRVVTGKRTRLRVGRAFVRAVLCAAFPSACSGASSAGTVVRSTTCSCGPPSSTTGCPAPRGRFPGRPCRNPEPRAAHEDGSSAGCPFSASTVASRSPLPAKSTATRFTG